MQNLWSQTTPGQPDDEASEIKDKRQKKKQNNAKEKFVTPNAPAELTYDQNELDQEKTVLDKLTDYLPIGLFGAKLGEDLNSAKDKKPAAVRDSYHGLLNFHNLARPSRQTDQTGTFKADLKGKRSRSRSINQSMDTSLRAKTPNKLDQSLAFDPVNDSKILDVEPIKESQE